MIRATPPVPVLVLLLMLPPLAPAPALTSPSDEVPPVASGCQYTRNIAKYREAGPVDDANGTPLPAGNVLCHWESPLVKTLEDFKTECDSHPECVGFSFTGSATPGGPPPAVGGGCLKNNYSPKLFRKENGWGNQPGFDGCKWSNYLLLLYFCVYLVALYKH